MVRRWRRHVFWMLPLLLSAIFLSSQGIIISAFDPATVYVEPANLVDLTLTEGKTFSIEISVSDVADLAAFQVVLGYDTNILTATDFSVYDPFTFAWPSQINDTAGFVYVFYSLPMGTEPGVSGTMKLVKIDFIVDALGLSLLELSTTNLAKPNGNTIEHSAIDGSFTNTKIHNLALKDVKTIPTRVAAPGDNMIISATVLNKGDFDEFFIAATSHSADVWIENKTDVFLAAGENTTLTFTWDTTGIAIGEYTLTVRAVLPTDNYLRDNTATLKVRIGVIRDVALTVVNVSATDVAEGEPVIIYATVKNQGNFTEDFQIVFKYDGTTVGSQDVTTLLPNFRNTLSINWNTEGLAGGSYVVSAEAVVEMDDNRDNNVLTGDTVHIGGTLPTIIFIYAAIGIVAIVAVLIVIRYALKLRRRKPS